jgi:hypothetical protein
VGSTPTAPANFIGHSPSSNGIRSGAEHNGGASPSWPTTLRSISIWANTVSCHDTEAGSMSRILRHFYVLCMDAYIIVVLDSGRHGPLDQGRFDSGRATHLWENSEMDYHATLRMSYSGFESRFSYHLDTHSKQNSIKKEKTVSSWPCRLVVRTPAFQAENGGSIPLGAANF